MFVSDQLGAGHFNIGVRSAFGDPDTRKAGELMLRYFVDFINHPELATGIWMNDPQNAPRFDAEEGRDYAINKLQRRQALTKIIENFNRGEFNSLKSIYNTIYRDLYYIKYEALRISDGDFPSQTIEIRAMLPQHRMHEFILAAELFELRMDYLKTQNAKIEFVPVDKRLSDQDKLNRYFLYVTDAGGDWEKFKDLIHPEFRWRKVSSFLINSPQKYGEQEYKELIKNLDLVKISPRVQQIAQEVISHGRMTNLNKKVERALDKIDYQVLKSTGYESSGKACRVAI